MTSLTSASSASTVHDRWSTQVPTALLTHIFTYIGIRTWWDFHPVLPSYNHGLPIDVVCYRWHCVARHDLQRYLLQQQQQAIGGANVAQTMAYHWIHRSW
jgi:hypothetical protein